MNKKSTVTLADIAGQPLAQDQYAAQPVISNVDAIASQIASQISPPDSVLQVRSSASKKLPRSVAQLFQVQLSEDVAINDIKKSLAHDIQMLRRKVSARGWPAIFKRLEKFLVDRNAYMEDLPFSCASLQLELKKSMRP